MSPLPGPDRRGKCDWADKGGDSPGPPLAGRVSAGRPRRRAAARRPRGRAADYAARAPAAAPGGSAAWPDPGRRRARMLRRLGPGPIRQPEAISGRLGPEPARAGITERSTRLHAASGRGGGSGERQGRGGGSGRMSVHGSRAGRRLVEDAWPGPDGPGPLVSRE